MKVYNYDDIKYSMEIAKIRLTVMVKLAHTDISIIEQKKVVTWLKSKLQEMDKRLSTLTDLEYELYKNVVVDNMTVTKAIENVASTTYKDVSTIWKYHYPKVKTYLKKIEKSKEGYCG